MAGSWSATRSRSSIRCTRQESCSRFVPVRWRPTPSSKDWRRATHPPRSLAGGVRSSTREWTVCVVWCASTTTDSALDSSSAPIHTSGEPSQICSSAICSRTRWTRCGSRWSRSIRPARRRSRRGAPGCPSIGHSTKPTSSSYRTVGSHRTAFGHRLPVDESHQRTDDADESGKHHPHQPHEVPVDLGIQRGYPTRELGEPAVDACEPAVDACEPAVDACEPVVDVCEPGVDACEPAVDSCEPLVDARKARVHMRETRVHVREPRMDLGEPSVHVAAQFRDRTSYVGYRLHLRLERSEPFFNGGHVVILIARASGRFYIVVATDRALGARCVPA